MLNLEEINPDNFYITIFNKKYIFNLEKLKEVCFVGDNESNVEKEITEAYTLNETTNELEMSSKIGREVKSTGDAHNDMIVYDVIKLFLERILNSDVNVMEEPIDVALALSLNTLIAFDLIIEI